MVRFIHSKGMSITDLNETGKMYVESLGIVLPIRDVGFIPTGVITGFHIEYIHYITLLYLTIMGILILMLILFKYFED